MKKFLLLTSCIILIFASTSCSKADTVDLAMVFNNSSGELEKNEFLKAIWEGIEDYCNTNNLSAKKHVSEQYFFQSQQVEIDTAIKDGAKVVVLAGALLEENAFVSQEKYPDIDFIMVDSKPNNGDSDNFQEYLLPNMCSIEFNEWQAGFLAGYASVMDGFTKLGFFGGMKIPPVIRFGYGFIQGAEYAASKLELDENSIEINYLYCGTFAPAPEIQTEAAKWYFSGTEVIFACGGAMGQSVIQASKSAENAWVIGVDADQSEDSETILTSAIKMVKPAVYNVIEQYYNGNFPSGKIVSLDIKDSGIALPMETSRFRKFNINDYNKIYDELMNNQNDINSDAFSDTMPIEEMSLDYVNIKAMTLK